MADCFTLWADGACRSSWIIANMFRISSTLTAGLQMSLIRSGARIGDIGEHLQPAV